VLFLSLVVRLRRRRILKMIGNPELIAGVATTIQLIRLSIYFVTQVQISTGRKNDDGDANSRSNTAGSIHTASVSEKTPLVNKGDGKSSYVVVGSDNEKDDNNNDEELGSTKESIYEYEPHHEVSPMAYFEIFLTKTSIVIQLALFVYFVISSFLDDSPDEPWLPIASPVFAIGAFLVLCDMKRNRFGFFQRSFNVASAIMVWVSSVVAYPSPLIWQINSLLFVYIFFTLSESFFIRYPEGDDISYLKILRIVADLSKPYLWPSNNSGVETSSEPAVLSNRIRVCSVWAVITLGRLCNVASPLLLARSAVALMTEENYDDAIKFALMYCALEFYGYAAYESCAILLPKVENTAHVELAEMAFSHVYSLGYDWHKTKNLDHVIRDVDDGITAWNTLMKYLLGNIIPFVGEVLAVCLILTLYFSNWQLAVVLFYSIFLYIVWTIVLEIWRRNNRNTSDEADQKKDNWPKSTIDSAPDFETVKYFCGEKFESKRYGEAVKRNQSNSNFAESVNSFRNISQRLIFLICLGATLVLSVIGIKNKELDIGGFVAALLYVIHLFHSLEYLDSVSSGVSAAFVHLLNLVSILALQHDVVDAPDAVTLDTLPTASWENEYAIEFNKVHFNYPSQPIEEGLKGISFKVKRGTTTAIVGEEGAGKTTMKRLLCRFFDIKRGCVKVNGLDIRGITQESLRDSIGVVPQAANVFNETIKSNVAYGRLHHTAVSQEELDEAANEAQLSAFIDTLDERWETIVDGDKLSDCEKQRMAIARCLLKHPPIVLLDNATSGLEAEMESKVQESLDRLCQKRSVLVITDKLNTIRNVNNIVFLKNGEVVEQGTHDELMGRRNGQYAKMWKLQQTNDDVQTDS